MIYKIINDPVHGFINIPNSLIGKIIAHRYFQRLKLIKQTGLIFIVYPGAHHTRFHHAIGAMHLMQVALQILKNKGIKISLDEENSALILSLLHDIGHGPFSHTLETFILEDMSHEKISMIYFELLNKEFEGKLEMAIEMFKNKYKRKFFHQLINSQLDVDRLDYLKRDSFFTGVSEGNISSKHILNMLNVFEDELVVEVKGIYSIEKYLTSRMFMYWQVYFHKTSLSAEVLLINAFRRAKELIFKGKQINSTNYLSFFLNKQSYKNIYKSIEKFTYLDDSDIYSSLKEWQFNEDNILSLLSKMILYRNLPKAKIIKKKISKTILDKYINQAENLYKIDNGKYIVNQKKITIIPYEINNNPIKLFENNKKIKNLNIHENQMLTKSLSEESIRFHLMIPNMNLDFL